jgi:hypothetical protein
MAASRRWVLPVAFTVSALPILALLGYGIHVWHSGDSDELRPKDSRACRGSSVPLREAFDHFGLSLPSDATEVHFDSTSHPLFGTYELRISFRTTSGSLARFLTKSGLPKPTVPDASSVGNDLEAPSCADTLPDASLYSADSPDLSDSSLSYQRKVLIGPAVKGELPVLINADDIDY